jgi:hypothetical protein
MSDSLVQLPKAVTAKALEEQLKHSASKAGDVFYTDSNAYTRAMEDVRNLVGQLAIALEIEDQARIRKLGTPEPSAVVVRMH